MENNEQLSNIESTGRKKKKLMIIFVVLLLICVLGFTFYEYFTENSKGKNVVDNYFTISFDSDGGSIVESIKVKESEKLKLPDNPTKDGYIFNSWKLKDEQTDNYNVIDNNYIVTKDIILKAFYTKDENNQKCNYDILSSQDSDTLFTWYDGMDECKEANIKISDIGIDIEVIINVDDHLLNNSVLKINKGNVNIINYAGTFKLIKISKFSDVFLLKTESEEQFINSYYSLIFDKDGNILAEFDAIKKTKEKFETFYKNYPYRVTVDSDNLTITEFISKEEVPTSVPTKEKCEQSNIIRYENTWKYFEGEVKLVNSISKTYYELNEQSCKELSQ